MRVNYCIEIDTYYIGMSTEPPGAVERGEHGKVCLPFFPLIDIFSFFFLSSFFSLVPDGTRGESRILFIWRKGTNDSSKWGWR